MATGWSNARGRKSLAAALSPFAILVLSCVLQQAWAEDAGAKKAKITIETKREAAPDSAYVLSGTTICSGGIESAVHQARIRITIEPAPGASDVVTVALADAGAGTRAHLWCWDLPAAKVRLSVDGGGTYTFGDPAPLSVPPAGVIMARLTSSNYEESTTLKVEVRAKAAAGAAAPVAIAAGEAKVGFVSAQPAIDWGDGPLLNGILHDFKVSLVFDGQPVDGHFMQARITRVHFKDGHEENCDIGLTQFDSSDFSNLIDVGGDGQVACWLSSIKDPSHNSPQMLLNDEVDEVSSMVTDITSVDKDPSPANSLQRDYSAFCGRFLNEWESGEPAACSFAFAGNNGQAGRLTLADALGKLGNHTGRKAYLMKWSVEGDGFPTLMHVTSYSIVHMPAKGNAEFCATEELFDVKLIDKKPYIVGYDIKDLTADRMRKARTFIERMSGRFHDVQRPMEVRLASGCSLAVALAQTANFVGFWETVAELEPMGLAQRPEELMQLRGVLEDTGREEPVPEKYRAVAGRLRGK